MKLSNKNVLVTGADGFIGSHLVELLIKKGAKVRALSYYNSFNFWGHLENIPDSDKFEVCSGDIRDPFYCNKICRDVEVVFNLAALIAIPYSYLAPKSYVDTNITGTVNICQAALDNKVKKLVQVSTSEVYGSALYVPIDEKHPLQPQSPYSASKIGSDAMAMSYHNAFGLPVTIARPFNTFGPRQSARAVIPTIISQVLAGRKKINIGDVSTRRDFTYVADTCLGMINICESEHSTGQVINVGSNSEISIKDLFRLISDLMGSKATLQVDKRRIRPVKSEVTRLWCDNTKYIQITGSKPVHNLEEGLKKTIEWFSDPSNLAKYKPGIYNL